MNVTKLRQASLEQEKHERERVARNSQVTVMLHSTIMLSKLLPYNTISFLSVSLTGPVAAHQSIIKTPFSASGIERRRTSHLDSSSNRETDAGVAEECIGGTVIFAEVEVDVSTVLIGSGE